MTPGAKNTICDIDGLFVGHAGDARVKTGATVLTGDKAFTAAVHVMGGAPGTRETDLLAPDKLVNEVDALVLAGGSAFGLDAASGVMAGLRAAGRGFAVGDQLVPIVPGAILFDLLNGGEKTWEDDFYHRLGRKAFAAAAPDTPLGSVGAGMGATAGALKGGLGSASLVLECGFTVGALVAVNAMGEVCQGDQGHFWAAPFEMGGEFGGRGPCPKVPPLQMPQLPKAPGEATTIAIVATDAALSQAQAQRLAIAAHDGLGRAIVPAHTPLDGDLVFAAATGAKPLSNPVEDSMQLCHAAAICLARAVARGVYEAQPAPGDAKPCWQALYA